MSEWMGFERSGAVLQAEFRRIYYQGLDLVVEHPA